MSSAEINTATPAPMRTPATARPWWREPWPWLLMAGPALAFTACLITIVLALDGYAQQPIDDGGRKQGLVVSKPGLSAATPAEPQTMRDTTTGDLP